MIKAIPISNIGTRHENALSGDLVKLGQGDGSGNEIRTPAKIELGQWASATREPREHAERSSGSRCSV